MMGLDDRIILKEIPFSSHFGRDYLELLLDTLPKSRKNDPSRPEWRPTPIIPLDLQPFGYTLVHIKDESDVRSNPTGTFKDRRAYENGPILFRAIAERAWSAHSEIDVPRLTDISMGNIAFAQAYMNERYGLPPPKLLLDSRTPPDKLQRLQQLRADIYLAPFDINVFTGKSEPYTAEQIRTLTNNSNGHDATSTRLLQPQRNWYDQHVHEAFNFFQRDGEIYVPHGSGDLFANYVTWQMITGLHGAAKKDIRLRVHPSVVASLDILGAMPSETKSNADKLTGHMPFTYYSANDILGLRQFGFTGQETGVYRIPEDYVAYAAEIMIQTGIKTEPSASIGLGLFMWRYDHGLIDKKKTVLIVNTGKGM